MLAYDQSPGGQAAAPAPMSLISGLNVLDLMSLLWRRRLPILGAALIGACVALAIGKSLTPKYTASAQLYVDPRELQLVDGELSPRTQDANNLPMVVESQARLLTSSSVLYRV